MTTKYELVDEKGPAHAKLFIAKVVLQGTNGRFREEHTGDGNSIKKAQHMAALKALESPSLGRVPSKPNEQNDKSTLVSRLNALAARMRSWADYRHEENVPGPNFWVNGEIGCNTTIQVTAAYCLRKLTPLLLGMPFCSTLLVDSTICSAIIQVDSTLLDSGSEQSKMVLVDSSFDSSLFENEFFY